MEELGSGRTKVMLLLLLLPALILGCLQNSADSSTKDAEMLGIKIRTDKELYVKEPVTIIVENVGNMTVKLNRRSRGRFAAMKGA